MKRVASSKSSLELFIKAGPNLNMRVQNLSKHIVSSKVRICTAEESAVSIEIVIKYMLMRKL